MLQFFKRKFEASQHVKLQPSYLLKCLSNIHMLTNTIFMYVLKYICTIAHLDDDLAISNGIEIVTTKLNFTKSAGECCNILNYTLTAVALRLFHAHCCCCCCCY